MALLLALALGWPMLVLLAQGLHQGSENSGEKYTGYGCE